MLALRPDTRFNITIDVYYPLASQTVFHKIALKLSCENSTDENTCFVQCLREILTSKGQSRNLASFPSVNNQDRFDNTALHCAAFSGNR